MLTGFIFNTLFGLSVNFWMAIATRFLLGALNGLLGPIKVLIGGICFILLVFQLTLYPYVERIIGPIIITRIAGGFIDTAFDKLHLHSNAIWVQPCLFDKLCFCDEECFICVYNNWIVPSAKQSSGKYIFFCLFSTFPCFQLFQIFAGNQVIFFILNSVEALGVILTFKPFLTQRAP
ncbi:hypothetical protein WN944_006783 [Citrus x changshan-huyou]|uniref:Uncharacterized protein n=1 Tax=Citrus x changshan-huyou TaxID=2935761 RepID=A0AAP0QU59_9ROSI